MPYITLKKRLDRRPQLLSFHRGIVLQLPLGRDCNWLGICARNFFVSKALMFLAIGEGQRWYIWYTLELRFSWCVFWELSWSFKGSGFGGFSGRLLFGESKKLLLETLGSQALERGPTWRTRSACPPLFCLNDSMYAALHVTSTETTVIIDQRFFPLHLQGQFISSRGNFFLNTADSARVC